MPRSVRRIALCPKRFPMSSESSQEFLRVSQELDHDEQREGLLRVRSVSDGSQSTSASARQPACSSAAEGLRYPPDPGPKQREGGSQGRPDEERLAGCLR